jgi:hypothetical protein
MEHGFYSLFFLARAIADEGMIDREMHWLVYGNGMQQVHQEAVPYPEKATVLGPCKVLTRELPRMTCAALDIDLPQRSRSKGFFGRKSEEPALPVRVDRFNQTRNQCPCQEWSFRLSRWVAMATAV